MNHKRAVTPSIISASTLILTRDAMQGTEVYLLKRSDKSEFMASHYVFPGGAVEADDRDWSFWESRVDVSAEYVDGSLGNDLPFELALAHAVAAVRETFEECGVLIVVEGSETILRSGGPPGPCQNRNEGSFRRKVAREGWVLALSSLRPWSHWITPEVSPKRYDTRFYLTGMPEGQQCSPDRLETTRGVWIRPQEALERNMKGDFRLAPPTLVTLHEIMDGHPLSGGHGEAGRTLWGETRVPRLTGSSKGPILMLPWDPDFSKVRPVHRPGFEKRVLPVDVPFSRLWLDNGTWRPVG